MKPVISPTGLNTVLDKNLTSIRECLDGGMSLDNFKGYVVSGTTDEIPDTKKYFNHSMAPQPVGWFPLVGDVYVQEINSKSLDVRATKPNVTFKIFVLQGTQITSEIAVPATTTKSTIDFTNELIQEAGGTVIQTNPLAVKPISIIATAAQGMSIVNISCAVADENYIYCTEDKTSGAGDIYRISKTTGTTDKLNVSANAIGPLYLDGLNLWTGENNTSTPTCFRVDTSTFTLAQTRGGLGDAGFGRLTRIYVDGTYIYGVGRSTNGTDRSTAYRFNKTDGTSETEVSMSNTVLVAISAGKDVVSDGTNIWLSETPGGANITLWKSSAVNFNNTDRVSYIYTGANARLMGAMRLVNNSIYGIIANTTEGSSPGTTVGVHGHSLLQFDIATSTFTEHPLAFCMQPGASIASSWILKCMVAKNGFVYIMNPQTAIGCEIIQFDTTNNTQTVGWFPVGVSPPVTVSAMHGAMIPDADGQPIVLLGNRAQRVNFTYFKPEFPVM